MKTYFVSSDIHGFYKEWMISLKEAGFDINNPNHIIIVCGDMCDRGSQAKECLQFVMHSLPKDRRILIRGNHEDLMEKVITKGYFESHDIHNGTNKTIYQLTDIWPDIENGSSANHTAIQEMRTNKLWNDYIKECVNFYEVGDNVFVHGWIPTIKSYGMFVDRIYPYEGDAWKRGQWSQSRWDNGMQMWYNGYGLPGKTIWCGHWHTSYAHCWYENDGPEFNETYYGEPIEKYDSEGNRVYANFSPFKATDENNCSIIALDACTVYSGKVNVVTFQL